MPFVPVPFVGLEVTQEIFDAGIAVPLGGVKSLSALTLMRSVCPAVTDNDENETVPGFGVPVVLLLTFVTANVTGPGTVIFTDSANTPLQTNAAKRTVATAPVTRFPVEFIF